MSESMLIEDVSEFEKKFEINKELSDETKKEVELNIPQGYISIQLPSNGKFEGIPKTLHFRNYSASESLDINVSNDEDKPNAIATVLKEMCLEKFDIASLPIQDVLYILYFIQATFIDGTITKRIILDENKDETEDNIEDVEIPISSLNCILCGKDKNDVDLKHQIKIPFIVEDKKENHKIKFKFATLKDTILAQKYCKNFYADEMLKFNSIRKRINDIQEMANETRKKEEMDLFLEKYFNECEEYFEFQKKYNITVAKVLQCLQIVSYDDKVLESLEEKWNVYSEKIPTNIWKTYNKITEEFKFGLDNEVEVYSNKLKKKLVKNIGFQLSDFISIDESESNDRYTVLFE